MGVRRMKGEKWEFDDWFFYGAITITVLVVAIVLIGACFMPDSKIQSPSNNCKSHISKCVAVGQLAVPVYSNECD